MQTLERASSIINSAPKEALGDAIGLAAIAFLIFAGFLTPAFSEVSRSPAVQCVAPPPRGRSFCSLIFRR